MKPKIVLRVVLQCDETELNELHALNVFHFARQFEFKGKRIVKLEKVRIEEADFNDDRS